MPIVGDRPVSGVRIELERARANADAADAHELSDPSGPPWIYRGEAHAPDATFALRVTVRADGEVEIASDAPPALAEKVRLIVRTAVRQAQSGDSGAREGEGPARNDPPRRIARWRGEK